MLAAVVVSLLWDRFPSPAQVADALTSTHLGWVVATVGLQLLSTGMFANQQHRLLSAFGVELPVLRVGAITYSSKIAGYQFQQGRPRRRSSAILDHDSPMMTAHYARLHDTTVRRHWEAARKVDITGRSVVVDPDGPLAEATLAQQRLGRATQALPNGFCGLPVQKSCPHANA